MASFSLAGRKFLSPTNYEHRKEAVVFQNPWCKIALKLH